MSETGAPELAPVFAQLKAVMPGIPDHDLPRFARSILRPGPYVLGDDSKPREGVARGTLTQRRFMRSGGAYPNVEREVRMYVPANLSPSRPASLMVFQDGARYLGPECAATSVSTT